MLPLCFFTALELSLTFFIRLLELNFEVRSFDNYKQVEILDKIYEGILIIFLFFSFHMQKYLSNSNFAFACALKRL